MIAFLAVDLLLVCTPGADWAYAIAAGLRGRLVVPAVTGLVAGYAGYTLLAVAGVVVLVARSASLLTVLTVLGAGYLVWLGVSTLARPAGRPEPTGTVGTSVLTVTEANRTVRRNDGDSGRPGATGWSPRVTAERGEAGLWACWCLEWTRRRRR
ncbi:MAG TPA: LysE family transporter [Actinocatenispora sp.]